MNVVEKARQPDLVSVDVAEQLRERARRQRVLLEPPRVEFFDERSRLRVAQCAALVIVIACFVLDVVQLSDEAEDLRGLNRVGDFDLLRGAHHVCPAVRECDRQRPRQGVVRRRCIADDSAVEPAEDTHTVDGALRLADVERGSSPCPS